MNGVQQPILVRRITKSPTSTTTYTVTVTDANGCTASASTTITVNTPPTASIAVAEISGSLNDDGTVLLPAMT
jgi:flavin reductase (DIM6/NTAB) family NADH-FMN oxidoreductase RutF